MKSQMTRKGQLAAALGVAVVFAGCGSDDGHNHGNTVDCDEDPRDEAYAPGMSKTGPGGLTFTLVEASPSPPARNDNVWTVALTQGESPVDGASLDVTPFMPDHNHGTPTVTITAPGSTGGQYILDPVNMFMPGYWEITIEATAGEVTDEVKFKFCIPS